MMTDNTLATRPGDNLRRWIAYVAWGGALAHALAIGVLIIFGWRFLSNPTEDLLVRSFGSTAIPGDDVAGKAVALLFFILCFVGFVFFLCSGYASEAYAQLNRPMRANQHHHAPQNDNHSHPESVVSMTAITSELARQFRHIASVGATSSFLALMGVFASALKSPVFQATFFGVAALPLVALSINPIREVLARKDAPEPAGSDRQAEEAPNVG